MKKFFLITFTLFYALLSDAEGRAIDMEWIYSHYDKREIMIPMRDGVKLFTCIYEPKDKSERHPILMNRTCYGSDPYGEKFMNLTSLRWSIYAEKNYILVFQDVRGKYKSEGEFEDLRPYLPNKKGREIDEASDTYDTAEWLIHNTHSNKKIGVHGISYPGFYATMAALSTHPAIKAVSPQAPVTDWFVGDDNHHNGALALLDMFSFEYQFQYLSDPDLREGKKPYPKNTPTDIVKHDVYTDYLNRGAVKNFSKLLGDSVRMWSETAKHPDYDDWWKERTVSNFVYNIKPAVLVVGGLFDAEDCYGAFETYRQIHLLSPKTDLFLVDGPWSHGAWRYPGASSLGAYDFGTEADEEWYMRNIEYPFFAYYLEGKGEKPEYAARVFDTGAHKWHNYKEAWTKETIQATPTAFYLQADGRICNQGSCCPKEENPVTQPSDYTEKTSYVSDPAHPVPFCSNITAMRRDADYMLDDQRFASCRPDVLTFQTEELTEPMTILGTPKVDFIVSISTTDADFIVKVIDVEPDGTEMLVRWEIMRGKYRNNLSKPEPFKPGEPTRLQFTLNDMAHTFLPGHRLMVQIQSSMFPLFDRNPQTFCDIYNSDDADFRPSTITVHHSKAYPSRIWLPVKD